MNSLIFMQKSTILSIGMLIFQYSLFSLIVFNTRELRKSICISLEVHWLCQRHRTDHPCFYACAYDADTGT